MAVSIKNFMLIQGGVEISMIPKAKEVVLNDCHLFNYLTGIWEKLIYKGDTFLNAAGHNAQIVIGKEKLLSKNYEFYNTHEQVTLKTNNPIKTEGIYFYGGRDENGNCTSYVKVLKIFKKPCELITLELNGKPPRPRYHSSFDFYSKLNICILYGGRNNDTFYRDIYILDLENLSWINTIFTLEQKSMRLQRACHITFLYENNLLIFGGENDQYYEGTDIISLDLDFENTEKYQKKHSINVSDNTNFFKGKLKLIKK